MSPHSQTLCYRRRRARRATDVWKDVDAFDVNGTLGGVRGARCTGNSERRAKPWTLSTVRNLRALWCAQLITKVDHWCPPVIHRLSRFISTVFQYVPAKVEESNSDYFIIYFCAPVASIVSKTWARAQCLWDNAGDVFTAGMGTRRKCSRDRDETEKLASPAETRR